MLTNVDIEMLVNVSIKMLVSVGIRTPYPDIIAQWG